MCDNSAEYHQLLIHQNLERIELAAVTAFQKQLEIPVVLLLDPADPAAKAMADTAGAATTVDQIISEYQRRGVVPVLIWHLSARVAQNLLRPTFLLSRIRCSPRFTNIPHCSRCARWDHACRTGIDLSILHCRGAVIFYRTSAVEYLLAGASHGSNRRPNR